MDPHSGYRHVGLSQWTSGAVAANVVLNQPGNASYTNLDQVTGRVIVRTAKSVDISSITVKLEGESTTRLMSPGGGPNNDRPRPQVEYHKILYKTQTVFPPIELVESIPTPKAAYTLPPGQHEYSFSFKLPFNNTCYNDKVGTSQLSMLPGTFEIARPAINHVRRTLPPTLSGFPGEAEIRYFVKVTVGRQSFFKENPRAYIPFKFFPIEPPRKRPSGSEVFARQRHSFSVNPYDTTPAANKKGLFGRKASAPAPTIPAESCQISIDARLPEPATVTCNKSLPLRLVLKRLSSFNGSIYLDSLQIALIGYTRIRAHETFRTESNSWIIMSKSNLNQLLSTSTDDTGNEVVVDNRLWADQPLPNTVAPSFQTCNITRDYQVDVRVGLKYAPSLQNASKAAQKAPGQQQSVFLPLRLSTAVYSGIAPPPELLSRMTESAPLQPAGSKTNTDADLKANAHIATPLTADQSGMHSNTVPMTDIDEPTVAAHDTTTTAPPEYSDAPPSYEDAIANDIAPLTAPRPEYAPPPEQDDHVLRGNEKRRVS